MKQFSKATIPLLCAAVAPLCADTGNMGQSKQMESQKQFEQRWRDNQITPIANQQTDGSWNPFITADYICWKAYADGLSYAYNGVAIMPSIPLSTSTGGVNPGSAAQGKVFRPKFEWESGFKVGIGNKFAHDGWDFYAQYTWLRSDAEDDEDEEECCVTEQIPAKSNFWLATVRTSEDVVMGGEGARWNLDSFNILDLELGRNFYISKFLTMRPFGGLKFSWQHQKYKVRYDNVTWIGDQDGIPSSINTIANPSDVQLEFKQREFGVGLRMGMNTQWYFCKWLGAYGDFALTALWNRFKERREVEVEGLTFNSNLDYDSENIKDKIYSLTGVLELGLGLFFEWAFHNDDYMFALSAGWEDQVWWNQNNFLYLMDANSHGSLSFQGFTLKAEFAF